MRSFILSGLFVATLGHASLLTPISRGAAVAFKGKVGSVASLAGNCDNGACKWYSQDSVIPSNNVTNCDPNLRTMGVSCGSVDPPDFPCLPGYGVPWCSPGTAPVYSPCGVFSGGWRSRGRDMRDLPPAPAATWAAGSVVQVGISIIANHGGGWAYRLCPSNSSLSEECFQNHHLPFYGKDQWLVGLNGETLATFPAVRTSSDKWARNPVPMEAGMHIKPVIPSAFGRGPHPFQVVDALQIPADLASGDYVLSWRWEAEQTKQVWAQCGDVHVTGGRPAASSAEPPNVPVWPNSKHVCDGHSLGLDIVDCDSWVDIYDALGGPNWPADWSPGGCNLRTDPCGCNEGSWQKYIQCNSKRDLLRITEIYLLGSTVAGKIPDSIGNMDELVSLSLVDTAMTGSIPDAFGKLVGLQMLWLDHNHQLTGPLPPSLSNLKDLSSIELHYSNFSGVLPALDWRQIQDCTLNHLVFDCPLPAGADSCGATCR